MDDELCWLAAADVAARIAAGTLDPVEVVAAALGRIDTVQPLLNCFADVWHDQARERAHAASAAVRRGDRLGPLHGVPVAVKDTTPTRGHRTTLGSVTHRDWIPDADTSIVTSLEAAGAIIVGKTTTPEFAHTLTTESPLLGITRNPWALDRTPGGSSGGSAAAVASGCVALAEGSDMGGSVRIPAAWCGIVGLKPSLGRIPMDTLPGMFDLLSHHGPLARTVGDAALFLQVTQGPSDLDIMSQGFPSDLGSIESGASGLRIGVCVDLGSWAVDDDIAAAVMATAGVLAGGGAQVRQVEVTVTADHLRAWRDMWAVFMAGYYGHFLDEFEAEMDPAVVDLIHHGNTISAPDYKRLELIRTDLWRRFAPIFADCDVLLCPTMSTGPTPASRADWAGPSPEADGRLHSPDMTEVFNLLAPCPALSIPGGLDRDGLPIGVQLVGRRWRDDLVLQAGRYVEQATTSIGRPTLFA